MKQEKIAKILAVIVSIVLVAILFSQIQITNIITTLAKINPSYLLIGFGLYVCVYIFRTLRFRTLLNHKIGFKNLFSIVCVHNMVNSILPARTGELSYIYLVKKSNGVPIGEGVATLGIARLFDFIAISLFFFVSSLLVKELPQMISNALFTIASFLIALVLFFVILIYKGEELMGILKHIAVKSRLIKLNLITFLFEKGNEAVNSFEFIQSKRTILSSFLFSILIWGSHYLMTFFLLIGMGIDLSLIRVILGATLSMFTTVFPIPTLGAFGTFEGVWTVAFIALGIPKTTAISIGFSVHIILFVYFLVLGCYGFLTMKTKE